MKLIQLAANSIEFKFLGDYISCIDCQDNTALQSFNCKTCNIGCCNKCYFPIDNTCINHPTPLRAIFLDHGTSIISRWKMKKDNPVNISSTFKDECSRTREMLLLCVKQIKRGGNRCFWRHFSINEEDVEYLRQFIRDQEHIFKNSQRGETKLACIVRVRALGNEVSLDDKTAKEKELHEVSYVNLELEKDLPSINIK